MAEGGYSTDEDSNICAICLDPWTGKNPRFLPCDHIFCLECLDELENHNSCPKCPLCCKEIFSKIEEVNNSEEILTHADPDTFENQVFKYFF